MIVLIVGWFVALASLGIAVILYLSQYKSMPAWIHKTTFLIRKIFRVLVYLGAAYLALFGILPEAIKSGAMWVFPDSEFGYAWKYDVSEKNVYIQPKPHDCEWDKAPIGRKYCHFDRVVNTEKDSSGKTVTVYVTWGKIEE